MKRLNTMILRFDRIKKRDSGSPGGRQLPAWRIFIILLALLLPAWIQAETVTHTVQRGETLFSISRQYNTTVDQLKQLNSLENNNILVGQVLKIGEEQPEKPDFRTPPVTGPGSGTETPSTPIPAADPVNNVPDLPADYYYTVQPGDNAFRVAQNHGVTLSDLKRWNNLDDAQPVIEIGDRLIIKDPAAIAGEATNPPEQSPAPVIRPQTATTDTLLVEKIYFVKRGDTLFSIARANGLTVDEIKARNNLSSNDITVGQKLWLAGIPPENQGSASGSETSRSDCALPTTGRVTSEFGMRRGRPHKGIDIANRSGTPIYAALDGVVVFSGVQRGYGNVILIEHPDFVMTVYAHNERNLVSVGQRVSRGQHIANMGSTGNSTGPHLHFEYRVKGTAINPRRVLPPL